MTQLAEKQRILAEVYEGWHNHAGWCAECLTIPDLEGRIVPFQPWPAQVRLFDAIRKQRELGRPVRIVYLKPRRVRVSAAAATHLFHETPFVANQHAFIVSYVKRSAKEIYSYIEHFTGHYQPYRKIIRLPEVETSNETYGIKWSNGSYIEIGTAKNVDTGRSFSLRHVLLDEFAFCPNASTLMTALLPAVPKDPGTSVLVVSTANGVGGAFYDMWQRACDRSRDNEWIPIFFGWWEDPSYKMPLNMPAPEFQASLSRNHPVFGDELSEREKYGLSLEQLYWRRWMIINECEGNLSKFQQEYPGEPSEAFISSGRPRFDSIALSRMPIVQDGITGDLEVQRIGNERRPTFSVRQDGRGSLTVFRRPERHRQYVIGGDPSEGHDVKSGEPGNSDPDWSVAQILDLETGEQVARYRERTQPAEFGKVLYDLGWWYNWAYQVPEAKGAGLGTIEKLLELEYPLDKLHRRRADIDRSGSTMLQYYGFETNMINRPQLVSMLDNAIREQAIIIRHPNTLQECRTFIIRPNGKAEHADECHDDEVLALALAVVGIAHAPRRKATTEAGPRGVAKYGKRRYTDDDD